MFLSGVFFVFDRGDLNILFKWVKVKEFIKEPTQNFKESKTLENASKRSTIAQHLLENKECGKAHKDENFEILYKCRNLSELRVLEAVVITFLEPSLCKQREFDFTTTLFWLR